MAQPMPSLATIADALLERGGAGGGTAAGGAMRRFCSSWLGAGVWIMLLSLAVYLPGVWSIPPVDRDESRFAQATRQMVESGDYVVPRVQDRPRLNKPPLIYWLQSLSVKVFGDKEGQFSNGNIWVFRLPSVLLAMGTVLLTWRLGLRMFDARAAALGAVLLCVSPMVVWDAHQARADQLLLFTVVLTQVALFAAWRGAETGRSGGWVRLAWASVFWLGIGLGIMAKGPITPLVAGLTVVGVSLATRSWKWVWRLQPLVGLVIVAAVVGPWVYAVGEKVGWERYWQIVYDETLRRSGEAKEGHWGPPGYHLVLLSVLLWPGSLLTAIAVGRAITRGMAVPSGAGTGGGLAARVGRWFRHARGARRAELFLLAWAVPMWIVMECVATKLPHYTMPLYPALALLSARAALSTRVLESAKTLGSKIGFAIWSGIGFFGLCLTLALAAGFGGLGESMGKAAAWGIAVVVPLVIGVLIWLAGGGGRATGQGRFVRTHVLGVCAIVLWAGVMLGVVLPNSEKLWVSKALAEKVSELAEGKETHVGLVGFHEDSAIFLLRGHGERIDADYAPIWIKRHPKGIIAIETSRFPDAAKMVENAGWDFGARVEGYNYSVGRHVVVELYSKR